MAACSKTTLQCCDNAQVTKKSSAEKFPSTSKFSDRSRSGDATHTVSLDTEFRAVSNPDEVVAPEDRVKAYKVWPGMTDNSLQLVKCLQGQYDASKPLGYGFSRHACTRVSAYGCYTDKAANGCCEITYVAWPQACMHKANMTGSGNQLSEMCLTEVLLAALW